MSQFIFHILAAIEKLQHEREAKKLAEAEAKRVEAEEVARKLREAEEAKKRQEEEARQLEEEKKRKVREERLRKREESRGDSFPNSDDLLVSNQSKSFPSDPNSLFLLPFNYRKKSTCSDFRQYFTTK